MTTKEVEIDGKKYTMHKTDAPITEGVVYGPYIPTDNIPWVTGEFHNKETEEYNQFMINYHKQHSCCPKCGSKNFTSTLVGYIFDTSKPDEYKDKNSCHYLDCGWRGIRHDLVPDIEAKQ